MQSGFCFQPHTKQQATHGHQQTTHGATQDLPLKTNILIIKILGHTKANIPNTALSGMREPFNQQAWEANLDPT
jgi:hypothetical protein